MRFLFGIFLFFAQLTFASTDFTILSFDGGGIRGVIPLTFISEIKKATNIDITKKARLVTGTSTGSIIAVGLAMNMDVDLLIEEYKKLAKQIFVPVDVSYIDYIIQIHTKYATTNLKNALNPLLHQHILHSDPKLGQCTKFLVIPTVRLTNPSTHRWHLDIHENFSKAGKNFPILDAILESTAAPTYFPSYKNCVDGGMGANNPSLVAISEVMKHKEAKMENIKVISFGTGYMVDSIAKDEDWGVYHWLFQITASSPTKTPLISMLFDLQDEVPSTICANLLGERFLRVDMPLEQSVALDDASKIDFLIQEVKQYIEKNPRKFEAICDWVRTNLSE